MNNRQMGPFGDFEINNADIIKDKRKKDIIVDDGENYSKNKKDRYLNQEKNRRKECNTKTSVLDKREQGRRERYEREAIEAERRERELEFGKWEKERSKNKSKTVGLMSKYKPRRPPPGYRDPHEVCKQALPVKLKEKKRQEIKSLMNCIAFTPSQTDLTGTSEVENMSPKRKEPMAEEMDNSSSSDTTSDITDVTPRSSSSGCSSMSKQSMYVDKAENFKEIGYVKEKPKNCETENKFQKREEEIIMKQSYDKNCDRDKKRDNHNDSEEQNRNSDEVALEEMKYMQDAFEDLDLDEETSDFASSIISGKLNFLLHARTHLIKVIIYFTFRRMLMVVTVYVKKKFSVDCMM